LIANAMRGGVERLHTTPVGQTLIQRSSRAASSHVDTGRTRLYSNYLANQQIRFE
jgi:hypothetical protein